MKFQSIGKWIDSQVAKVRPATAKSLKYVATKVEKVATKMEPKKSE